MSERLETVLDVLGHMERDAAELLTGRGYPMTPIRFKCLCNELAAAVEMEALAKSGAGGESAPAHPLAESLYKLRAALEKICEAIAIDGNTARTSLSLFEFRGIAETALATPLRNCDRFRNADEALGHFITEYYHGSDHEWNGDRAPRVHAFRWLFDMAQEKAASGSAAKIMGLAEELRKATIDWDGNGIALRQEAVQGFADRLAAIARELAGNPEQPANTVAAREALEYLLDNEGTIFRADLNGLEEECFYRIVEKARKALSAPVRNCDIYRDGHAAWLAWQAKCAEMLPNPGPRFAEWLLSAADPAKPAKPEEGAV